MAGLEIPAPVGRTRKSGDVSLAYLAVLFRGELRAGSLPMAA
jgi:hypothetical protein